MIVSRLDFDGFRNLQKGSLIPGEGVNIIYGRNAQGKTNLLELLWFFTGGRSFRGAKDAETVAFDRQAAGQKARLCMTFTAADREQEAEIAIDRRRSAVLNGIPQPTAAKLAGHFCAIVFSPAHLSLIKDGPEGRRRFLDAAYCQLRPGYMKVLADYQRILAQRNAMLKTLRCSCTTEDRDTLDVWNDRLSMAGAQVYAARTAYIRKLSPVAQQIYAGIAKSGEEQLTLRYQSAAGEETLTPAEMQLRLRHCLQESLAADLAAGFTTVGPHRDDLVVDIGGISAKAYGSQGQQRSAVLALKLAEASVLKDVTGEQPVALLDDVMSELDTTRQDYVLNHIHGWQVFLTCCDPSPVQRLTGGKVFHVEQGRVTEEVP